MEAAVIWVVPSRGIEVPVIPGAGKCAELAQLLVPADVRLNPGVAKIGFASASKMCRSIMVKGPEALTVERVPTARCYMASRSKCSPR